MGSRGLISSLFLLQTPGSLCKIKKKDEETKNRKDVEAANKAKNKLVASATNQVSPQLNDTQHVITHVTSNDAGNKDNQQQFRLQKEKENSDDWQTQKKKNIKGKNSNIQLNKIYKPTSPKNQQDNTLQTQSEQQ